MNIDCTISGLTPLLFNRFTDAAQIAATEGTSQSSSAGDRGTPHEQAQVLLHADEGGNVIMPADNIMKSIVYGGLFFKIGRNKISTQKSSLLYAFLTLSDLYYKLDYNEPWTIDARPVRNPSTGGRFLKYRPCFNDWGVSFSMELEEKELGVKLLRDIIDAAGKRSGLGDFRPSTKGPFGKYVVSSWNVDSSKK
jgi:hypothetical protein